MEELPGVEWYLMSGTRAAIVLEPGAELDEETVREAIEGAKLEFESFGPRQSTRPQAAFVVVSPPVT